MQNERAGNSNYYPDFCMDWYQKGRWSGKLEAGLWSPQSPGSSSPLQHASLRPFARLEKGKSPESKYYLYSALFMMFAIPYTFAHYKSL